MDRVNGANWIDIGAGRRGFRSLNVAAGLPGTEVTALWLNMVQEEIAAVVLDAGLVLDPADWTQLLQALRRLTRGGRANLPVDGWQAAPPGSPVDGTAYVVAAAPTGGWAGQAQKLAFRFGGAWFFVPALAGQVATMWQAGALVALRFNGTVWDYWRASTTQYGPVKFATAAQIEAKTPDLATAPDQLAAARTPYFVATSGGGATTVPSGVDTVLTHLSLQSSFLPAGSTFVNGVFTCGADVVGLWEFDGLVAFTFPSYPGSIVVRSSVSRNGTAAPFDGRYAYESGTWTGASSFAWSLGAGDIVRSLGFQNTGVNRNAEGGSFRGRRIGGG